MSRSSAVLNFSGSGLDVQITCSEGPIYQLVVNEEEVVLEQDEMKQLSTFMAAAARLGSVLGVKNEPDL